MAETYSAGIVTAYGAAVRGGYTGTYEQWCQDMAQLGDNVSEVREKAAQVEQTAQEFTQTIIPAAIQSVENEGTAQVGAVEAAGAAQVQAVETAGTTQAGNVNAAGAAQVQAVNDEGVLKVGAVEAAGAAQVQAVEDAGTDAEADIDAAKAAAITDLQAESTTQQAAIQQKGEDTRASIPDDYTALSDEVVELKSAFNKTFYYPTLSSSDIVDSYYINGGNGYTVSNASYKCTDYISLKDIIKGNALHCKITCNGAAGYAFYNSSKTYITGENGTSRGYTSTRSEVLRIPDNAEYFRASLISSEYSSPSDFEIGFENFNKAVEVEDKKIGELRNSLNNGKQTFALYSDFQQAGLNPNGTLKPEQNYRVSCGEHIKFDKAILVSVQSGYQWGYIPFVNGSTGSWSGWKNTDYTIPANTEFVVQIMHAPESTSTPANVDAFVSAVTFNTLIGKIDDALKFDFKAYHGTITSISNVKNYPNENEVFSAGSVVFTTNGESCCGIDEDILNPIGGNVLRVHSERSTGNNWGIRIVSYDSSNSIITNVNTSGNDLLVPIPLNAKKVNITLGACWGTALASATSVTFSNISVKYLFAEGTGNQLYKGKPIVLVNDNQQINKCNISLWKDFKGSEITGLADYSLHLNEAMAIYGGYVFLFNGGGGGVVLDYSTKNIVSTFTTTPTEDNHQNSAQFTNIYHTAGDEFPLLLVARCGNSNGTTTGKDECLVYRVTGSNTTFTFTLINSIAFDKRTYGTSWGVDNATNTLYLTSTINGNWSVTTNNPLNWWAFNLPSKESILSGNPITLTDADVIAHAEAEFAVQQGCSVKHGLMYEAVSQLNGTQIKDAMIYAVDVFKNQIVSKVPLLSTDEPEGVDVYNGKLYVTQKKGTDTAGNNPLKIYEIEF